MKCYTGPQKLLTFVNTILHLQVPKKVGNFMTSLVTVSFSRMTALWSWLFWFGLDWVGWVWFGFGFWLVWLGLVGRLVS